MKQIYGLLTAFLIMALPSPLPAAHAASLDEAFLALPDCTNGALSAEQSEVLKVHVQNFHATHHGTRTPPFETLFENGVAVAAVSSLRQGHDDVVIYLMSDDFCKAGRCGMLILNQTSANPKKPQNRYRVVGHVAAAQLPIRVLPSEHYKWPDLGFGNADAGRDNGYAERLEFSGRHYPSTTTPVARYEKKKLPSGRELIGTDTRNVSQLCRLR